MRKLTFAAAVLAVLIGFSASTEASSITLQLDCFFVSPASCPSLGFSYGTITITDDPGFLAANQVEITADLVSTFTIKTLFLNYSFDANSGNTLTTSNSSIAVSQDGIQADGLSGGLFDIGFPLDFANQSLNVNVFTTVLTATGGTSLDPADFNLLNTNNLLFGAVHVGNTNCNVNQIVNEGCLPSTTATGQQSLWVGATTTIVPDPTPVPEPATVALLSFGLAGLAAHRRRRRQ